MSGRLNAGQVAKLAKQARQINQSVKTDMTTGEVVYTVEFLGTWTDAWDLSTIPETLWASEHGRRMRLKRRTPPQKRLKACPACGRQASATERRKPCPCGRIWPMKER